eukprot:gb/GEZN01013223.1/.p1 GENE.gb/GEZN01013223.1/~~gb/GEZN01013223.1/.p1  ORF type:complete len:157 (+),score=5.49 gb/GEZN01013223.1/:53-472(+)
MFFPEVLRAEKVFVERTARPSLARVCAGADMLRSADSAINQRLKHFEGACKRGKVLAFCRPLLLCTTKKGSPIVDSDTGTSDTPPNKDREVPTLDCYTPTQPAQTPQFALSEIELRSISSPTKTFGTLCFGTPPLTCNH